MKYTLPYTDYTILFLLDRRLPVIPQRTLHIRAAFK